MSSQTRSIKEILAYKGIKDSSDYLDERQDIPSSSDTPYVELRGSVHLMLGQTVTRKEVDDGLDRLRWA